MSSVPVGKSSVLDLMHERQLPGHYQNMKISLDNFSIFYLEMSQIIIIHLRSSTGTQPD